MKFGGEYRSRTGLNGVAVHCITALLTRLFRNKYQHTCYLLLLHPFNEKERSGKRDSPKSGETTPTLATLISYSTSKKEVWSGKRDSPKSGETTPTLATLISYSTSKKEVWSGKRDSPNSGETTPTLAILISYSTSENGGLERETRFELATPTLARLCSTS